MACERPIRARQNAAGEIKLLRGVANSEAKIKGGLELPCGSCLSCKIKRSTDWAIRCQHEAELYTTPDRGTNGCFLTLTFSEDGLGLRELKYGTHPLSLSVADWQLFAKRLRKEVGRFRFFMVGEYGEENQRPHYHALVFGQDFIGDRTKWKTENGNPLYESPSVTKTWPYGQHSIQDITPETINYVCRYVQKKLYGNQLARWLERIDSETGECVTVKPEFATMSRGGEGKGIGSRWYEKFKTDLFPDDFVTREGKKLGVPTYYAKLHQKQEPEEWEKIRAKREESARARMADNTPTRRKVRAKIVRARGALTPSRKLDTD